METDNCNSQKSMLYISYKRKADITRSDCEGSMQGKLRLHQPEVVLQAALTQNIK